MKESTRNDLKAGLKHVAAKAMMNPKVLIGSGLLLIQTAPAVVVAGAIGAAGYGIIRLIKKNEESKQETV